MYYLGRSLDCCTNSFPVDLVAPGIRPLPPPPFFLLSKGLVFFDFEGVVEVPALVDVAAHVCFVAVRHFLFKRDEHVVVGGRLFSPMQARPFTKEGRGKGRL